MMNEQPKKTNGDPTAPRNTVGVGSTILAAGLLALLACTGCSADLRNARPDFATSAVSIALDYEGDPAGSEKRYFGKVIEVKGLVNTVNDGGYTVNLMGANRVQVISFGMASQSEGARLHHGDEVTIRGKCGMLLGTYLSVFNGIIVQPGHPEALLQKAPAHADRSAELASRR
jgi:hypothetical protein